MKEAKSIIFLLLSQSILDFFSFNSLVFLYYWESIIPALEYK